MIWPNLSAVAVGAFAGGCLRSLASGWLNRKDYAIPCGTLLVNLAGSLLVGIMLGAVAMGSVAEPWKALLITGFCGGLTTFSTFSADTYKLLQTNARQAIALVLASLFLGMLLYALGHRLPRRNAHADVV